MFAKQCNEGQEYISHTCMNPVCHLLKQDLVYLSVKCVLHFRMSIAFAMFSQAILVHPELISVIVFNEMRKYLTRHYPKSRLVNALKW